MSEILEANQPGPDQVRVGMDVAGADNGAIGRVKELRDADFLVDRPMARDVFVPYSAVMSLPDLTETMGGGSRVVLNVTAAHVDRQGWPRP